MAIGTPDLEQAVAKALERAGELGEDLRTLARRARDAAPAELATEGEKRERKRFLETLYGEERQAEKAYERIIAGNELQEVAFLPRGALVARTVLRIVLRRPGGGLLGYGSGVLVGDGVLLTNHHVLQNAAMAANAEAQAYYEVDVDGDDETERSFALEPEKLFFSCEPLDFSVVAVAPQDRSGREKLAAIGWIPLIGGTGKAAEGEWLNIVQHPRGERKQLAIRENKLLKRADDVLWYSTDTLGGSSGSPVFNNNWLMVALHHMGVPETRSGRWQTVDGRDYEPGRDSEEQIRWIANEGIRVSRILETLRREKGDHPLVKPILDVDIADIRTHMPISFRNGENVAKLLAEAFITRIAPRHSNQTTASAPAAAASGNPTSSEESDMPTRRINVTLEIDDDGNVRVVGKGVTESALLEDTRSGAGRPNLIFAPVEPKRDWVGGYDPDFLSDGAAPDPDLHVPLPIVQDTGKIAPLKDAYGQTFTAQQRAEGVLKYKGYSVVQNKDRRFAFFSAANVDGGMMPKISGRDDDWMFDDRIDRSHQVDNSFYKGTKVKENRFDRGHLTRRDDMEWGSNPVDAVNRANGTCTWPNCAPQHERFNQGTEPGFLLWGQLEKYILEQTVDVHKFRLQVMTGPVFGIGDPVFRNIAYPLEYWKVVVAVAAGDKLFATAYLLGQKEMIDKYGIEAAPAEPFGEFGTYQRKISKIEDLTGLKFTYGNGKSLSDVDPLERAAKSGGRRRGAQESFGTDDDDALRNLSEIVLA